MSLAITIDFPVRRHVKKFLTKKYGYNTVEVSRSDAIGYLIISLLNRNDEKSDSKKILDTVFSVKIKESIYLKNGFFIKKSKLLLFDKLVDKLFREELLHYSQMAYINYGVSVVDAVYDFCEYYNVTDEDINIESLIRDMKRRKVKLPA